MYWRNTAHLIREEKTPDDEGYKTVKETRRRVFCNEKSATRSEFYTAKQAGDKIVLVLEVRGADYKGETRVEYNGGTYEVVRTYTRNGEKYELNCKEAKQGAQEAQDATGEEDGS